MKKRLLSLFSLALAGMMLFAACAGGGGDTTTAAGGDTTAAPATTAPPTTTAPQQSVSQAGETARTDLVMGLVGEPKTMDPTEVSDLISYGVFFQIYDYLIRFEADDSLQPGIAESWEVSDDGLQVTYHLREGVKFWNGDPVTAEDVVFSINKAINSSYTNSSTNMMENMEKVDDKTVVLNLKFPYGPIDYCISSAQMAIISESHYNEVGAEGFARSPMGCGPYVYEEWASGDKLTLTRFDEYWRGPAQIENMTFKFLTDGTTAVLALQNGEVDIVDTPPAADRETLINDDRLTYYETEIAASVFVAFNNAEGKFADKRMRKAVMMTVDKEAMIEGAREGLGTPLSTWWPIPIGGWDSSVPFEGIPYDLEGAKALFVEAGYGEGLTLELRTTDSATYNKPTEVLQDMLAQAGVKGEINRLERSSFFESVQTERDFEMCVLASTTGVPDVDYIYSTFHGSQVDGGRNYMGVKNDELDRLLEAGRASNDQDERAQIYRDVATLWNEEVFSGCLYTYLTPICADKDLQGVIINSKNRIYVYDYWWAA